MNDLNIVTSVPNFKSSRQVLCPQLSHSSFPVVVVVKSVCLLLPFLSVSACLPVSIVVILSLLSPSFPVYPAPLHVSLIRTIISIITILLVQRIKFPSLPVLVVVP